MTEQPTPRAVDPERTVVPEPREAAPVSPAPPPAAEPENTSPVEERSRSRWYVRIWSNLNLNGPVPARVRPAIGEWGPTGVPSTKHKKRVRWLTPVAFVLVLAALVLAGWFFWTAFK